MGWTGGYVLLALLLAPYLRKFGKFTVPEFIGDRFYSGGARLVAVVCLIVISVTYVIGQMRGVGVTFSRFLEVSTDTGLYIGAAIVFAYAVLGGMKGITYTQVAQYVVLIIAYTIPAIFISLQLTGNFLPQLGLIGSYAPSGGDVALLAKLDQVVTELGFTAYTADIAEHAQHVPVHHVADDRHRGSAARHHPLLHGAEGGRRAVFGRLGAGVHRAALHGRSGRRLDGASEPDHHHLAGCGDRQRA